MAGHQLLLRPEMPDDVSDQIEDDLNTMAQIRRGVVGFDAVDKREDHPMLGVNLGMTGFGPLVHRHGRQTITLVIVRHVKKLGV